MIDYNALNTEINTDQWKVIPAYPDNTQQFAINNKQCL